MIKLWNKNSPKPIAIFDLKCPINDIEWAPYSATVFAAVTSAADLIVYDLNIDKH